MHVPWTREREEEAYKKNSSKENSRLFLELQARDPIWSRRMCVGPFIVVKARVIKGFTSGFILIGYQIILLSTSIKDRLGFTVDKPTWVLHCHNQYPGLGDGGSHEWKGVVVGKFELNP